MRRPDQWAVRRLHAILEVPLELKLIGANLIIVVVALLLMFGPVELQPSRVTDASVAVAVMAVSNPGKSCGRTAAVDDVTLETFEGLRLPPKLECRCLQTFAGFG